MTLAGNVSLWLALLLALWGVVVGALAEARRDAVLQRSALRVPLTLVGLLSVVILSLATAVVRQDFNVAFIAASATRALPVPYGLGTIAASLAGSLLVVTWGLCLAGAGLLRATDEAVRLRTATVLSGIAVIGVAGLLAEHPFARLGYTPLEGTGLVAFPRHPLALFELAIILLGFSALAATAVVALSRRPGGGASWAGIELAWILLSLGLGVRLWRVYALDAVEPVSVWRHLGLGATVAWLAAAAVFHLRARPRLGEWVSVGGMALASLAALMAATNAAQDLRLSAGAQARVGVSSDALALVNLGVSRFEIPGGVVAAVSLESRQDSGSGVLMTAELRHYVDIYGRQVGESEFRPALLHRFARDVRVTVRPSSASMGRFLSDVALFHVRVFPLAWGAWAGFGLMALGGLMAWGRRATPGAGAA